MDELRWILLLVGVLFLVVLAAWETRRSHRATVAREPFPHFEHEPAHEPAREPAREPAPHLDGADAEPIRAQRGGPLRELPQMSAERLGAPAAQAPPIEPAPIEPAPIEPPRLEPQGEGSPDAVSGTSPPRTTSAPVVDWPPEGERLIISIRVVGIGEQRLSGRSARQALAACGFVHGRYRIFHQPAEDGRALLSCASLSRPGNFDPSSMDSQRLSGLSVFTVLPGPLSGPAALERLLDTARDLSDRLEARLLDDQGQPLDAARVSALRGSVQQLGLVIRAGPAAADGGSGA